MPNIRKILLYGLPLAIVSFAIFLTPIFYQTYQFYNSYQVSFPEKEKASKTTVYLIGTQHVPTQQYNKDTVYYYLEKIQPDLILLEMDSSFFRGDRLRRKYTFAMRFYPFLRKYWNLEMLAATKYAKYHDEVRLAPFEWQRKREVIKEIRNKRSALNLALFETRTDSSNQIFHERGKIMFHYLKEQTTLQGFNNVKNDAVLERLKHLQYEVIPRMVLANDSLHENHEFARKYQSYWPTRNEHMAENIIEAVKLNPDKKIVVLTGFAHRYILRKLLNESPGTLDFDLLDYQGKPL